MNYADFNGLGLLGQPILCINEKEETCASPNNYDELIESRNALSASLEEFIEQKNIVNQDNDITHAIAAFKMFFDENLRDEHYHKLVQLDNRISTLDRAIVILHNEYSRRHSVLMESIQIPKMYPNLIEDYLIPFQKQCPMMHWSIQ